MQVNELIKILQTMPPDLPVVYRCCSEYCLLDEEDLKIDTLGPARGDGWVHEKRPDRPTQRYLVFPGN